MQIQIPLHKAQLEVVNGMRRFNALRCGRRWGKTRLMFALAARALYAGVPVAYMAPNWPDLVTRWEEAEKFFNPVLMSALEEKGTMRLKGTRAPFDWFGLHRYDAVRGNKYGLVLIDEAAHVADLEPAWTKAIRPTLVDYKGGAIFASTPEYGSYFNTVICKKDAANWAQFHYPTTTNPFIDPAEVEEARQDTASISFAQEYLAELVVLQGARVKREWLQYGEPPEGSTYTLGVDLAISKTSQADYSAIVAVAKHDDSYYIAQVHRAKMSFFETVEAIKQMARKYNPSAIVIETVAYQASVVQELVRTTTLPIKAARPSKDKITRFIPVEGKYEHGHIYHSKNLPSFFEDELLTFPSGPHDDMADALGYAIAGHAYTFFAFSA